MIDIDDDLPPTAAELLRSCPPSAFLCQTCLQDQARTMFFRPFPSVIAAYCSHTQSGGLIDGNANLPTWYVYRPVTMDQWAEMMADATVAIITAAPSP